MISHADSKSIQTLVKRNFNDFWDLFDRVEYNITVGLFTVYNIPRVWEKYLDIIGYTINVYRI